MAFSLTGAISRGMAGFIEGGFDNGQDDLRLTEKTSDVGRNERRWTLYERNWEFYRNTAFEDLSRWEEYMTDRGLYEETRIIYNPMRRLVEFYAGRLYPGQISTDGTKLPYSVRNAVPFTLETSEAIKRASAQVMEWSRWQVKKSVWVRRTAAQGVTILEVVDDVERGQVRLRIWEATKIKDYRLNQAGNLDWYWLKYEARDEGTGEIYWYERRVTRTAVTEYRNDEVTKVTPSSYGFVPAMLTFHKDVGTDFGADVFEGDYVRLEELNSVATHGLDNLHKNIDPSIILWTDTRLKQALQKANDTQSTGGARGGETSGGDWEFVQSRDFKIIRGGAGGRSEPLVGRLASNEVIEHLKFLTEQIEKDHPELVYYDKLREMDYVSGPGARALVGDTESNFLEAQANYDEALARALEMALAIGGQRLAQGEGGWNRGSAKQQNLKGFDLESWERDELNVGIEQRPLLPWTVDDETAVKKGRAEVAVMIGGFASKNKQLEEYGIDEQSERDGILEERDDEQAKQMEQAQAMKGADENMAGNAARSTGVPQKGKKKKQG